MVEEILKNSRPDGEDNSQVVNAAVKKAQDNLEQGLQMARDAGDETSEIDVLIGMSDALIQLDETSKAEKCLQRALEQSRAIGDKKREGTVRYRQTRLEMRDLSDAKQLYEFLKSIESIAVEIGNREHANIASGEASNLRDSLEMAPLPPLFKKPRVAMQGFFNMIGLVPENIPRETELNNPRGLGYFDLKRRESAIESGYCPEIEYTGHAREGGSQMWLDGVFSHLCAAGIRSFALPLAGPVEPGAYSEDENEQKNRHARIMVEDGDESLEGAVFSFPDCMKLKAIITTREPKAEEWATAWIWFAPGVGLLKVYFKYANGETTEIDLIDYRLTEKSDDYFPLALDNTWVYRWSKSDGKYMITEKWRVLYTVDEPDYGDCDAFRLVHSRYHLYMPGIPNTDGIEKEWKV